MALIDNLISYYKLDGNSNDAHGSNNGTVQGATYTASGKINGAYDFDGNNDYIELNSTISKLFEGTKNYTFSCWAKFDNLNSDKYLLSSITSTSSDYRYRNFLIGGNSSGALACGRYSNSSIADWCETPSSTITTNTWYHIVATYDGSQMKIYVNGSLPTGTNNPKTSTRSASDGGNANLGSIIQSNNRSFYFNGIMDEVGIWSRALSASEISELYNGGAGLSYPFTTTPTSNPLLAFNF